MDPPLDPEPQNVHAGDLEGAHPESCYCTECWGKRSPIPFDPWFNEPKQIAKLYRWLKMRDRLPEDPADFIEHAETWAQDYADMCMWAGPA